jgi:hypothetical protein
MNDKTIQNVFDSVFGARADQAQHSPIVLLAVFAIAMTAAVLILEPSWPAVAGVMSMNGMVAVVCLALSKQSRE